MRASEEVSTGATFVRIGAIVLLQAEVTVPAALPTVPAGCLETRCRLADLSLCSFFVLNNLSPFVALSMCQWSQTSPLRKKALVARSPPAPR